MFDAINIASRFNEKSPTKPIFTFETYSQNLPAPKKVSVDMAIAHAAGETLKVLYKEQAGVIADFVLQDERAILNGKDGSSAFYREGRAPGIAAAKAIWAARDNDGSAHAEPEVIKDKDFPLALEPRKWRPDPVSNVITALGGKCGGVKLCEAILSSNVN